jgi:hypothetical protein
MGNLLAALAAPAVGNRPGLGDNLHVLPSQGISMNLKTLVRLEELTLVALSFYLFLALDFAWWWFPVLFFVPDISLAGYLIHPKVGAISYNFIHHKAVSILVYLLGSFTHLPGLQLAGVVLFGHSSLDRALGFGLQESTSKGK